METKSAVASCSRRLVSASFGQNAPASAALILRSRAIGPRKQIFTAFRRCVSKHEGAVAAVLILRDARKHVRILRHVFGMRAPQDEDEHCALLGFVWPKCTALSCPHAEEPRVRVRAHRPSPRSRAASRSMRAR